MSIYLTFSRGGQTKFIAWARATDRDVHQLGTSPIPGTVVVELIIGCDERDVAATAATKAYWQGVALGFDAACRE